MKYPVLYFLLISLFFIYACNQHTTAGDEKDGLAAFNTDSLKKNIAVLASDAFEGRMPFTPGETKTINYLQEQFAAVGLEPGNGNSYFQEVPMVNIKTEADSFMQIHSAKGDFRLKGFDDYVIWTDKTDSFLQLDKDELVFAGYGVVSPENNWNDYAGLNVKGKVVMVLVNDPGFNDHDKNLFRGDTMTWYGRWMYKYEEAARQGAKGCLIIHNTIAASYPFDVIQNNWNVSKLKLDDRSKKENTCDVVGWISSGAAQKLLAAGGYDSTLLAKADQRNFKTVPLQLQLSTKLHVKTTYNLSHNVIGKITGTKHPDEYIIYSAHWDHLGIGKPDEKGDSIYNGAYDNASGAAGLIELARGFKSMKTKSERTIIFLSVTAEEQGLWGAAYYVQHPLYPLAKTLADINMDGINPFEKTNDVVLVGKGQSDLEDFIHEEAKKIGRYVSDDVHPAAGSYYRSDHFCFAKAGVPAIYIKKGMDIIGKGKAYGIKTDDEYKLSHYHRPADEYDPKTWVLAAGIEDLKLLFLLGRRVAFQQKWPQWKQGSEFKAIREKYLH